MEYTKLAEKNTESSPRSGPVWDFATRLFHWSLVILVVISFVIGQIGGNAMQHHELSGATILVLLVFRLVWGFAGSPALRPS